MADVGELHFVDHVECKIHSPDKEVISPTKSIKPVFPMTNGAGKGDSKPGKEPLKNVNEKSIDAVNNNTEASAKVTGINVKAKQVEVTIKDDLYLGKEVSLHDQDANSADGKGGTYKSEFNVNEKRETSSATMNLFWYSGSAMNVDLEEIEAFKNSKDETYTSSLQITTGNGYYRTKNDGGEKVANGVHSTAEMKSQFNTKQEKMETWSAAFESASSRILGLASELKGQPKQASSVENAARKEDHHPWGLESGQKVVTVDGEVSTEVLPDLSELEAGKNIHDTVDGQVKGREDVRRVKASNKSKQHAEDVADAVGYMDIKDKPNKKVANQNNSSTDSTDQVVKEKLFSVEQSSLERNFQTDAKVSSKSQSVEQFISPAKSQSVYSKQGTDVVDGGKKVVPMVEEVVQSSDTTPLQTAIKETVYDPFTVKRTYYISEKSEAQLHNNGGIFIETETLVDEYLDDGDYSLTLKDCWLRLRNKKFEMKLNAGFGSAKGTDQLLTGEQEIKEALLNMFSREFEQRRKVSENQLDVIVDSLAMEEFTTFETVRSKYQVGNCMVTIDSTNFGVMNGQIEMMAENPSKIPDVLTTIEKLSTDIGKL